MGYRSSVQGVCHELRENAAFSREFFAVFVVSVRKVSGLRELVPESPGGQLEGVESTPPGTNCVIV